MFFFNIFTDINNWNTNNVTNMKELFCNCSSLKNIPDISKWNTIKVKTMVGLFKECNSKIYLPDISK